MRWLRRKTTWWMKKLMKALDVLLTHEHVTCTLDAGGDAPQLTSKETRPTARYARQSTGTFVDPKPRLPGRDPVRACGGYGLLQVDSLAPRASWIRSPPA